MDPNANKLNSETPSPLIALESQLVYKIASLEATIANSLRRLDEKFDRMQTELHDRHIDTTAQITTLSASVENRLTLKRARMDAFDRELHRMKDDQVKVCQEIKEKAEAKVDGEIEKIVARVVDLEKWKTIVVTRVATIGSGLFIVWAMFGQHVQDFFGRVFS